MTWLTQQVIQRVGAGNCLRNKSEKTMKIIILLIFSNLIYAQVNTEKFRKPIEYEGLSGYVEIALSSRSGNVDITEVNIENRNDYVWKNMNTNSFLIMQGNFGWQGGTQYSDEALTHLRHVLRIKTNLQPEFFAQIDYNKKRLLMFRGLFGGGLRFAVYNHNKTKLWYGTAFMLENERLDLSDTDFHKKEVSVIRWSNYFSFNVDLNDQLNWTSTTYFQPLINDLGDTRILSETNLKVRLIEQLSFLLGFKFRYDSMPPKEIKSLDTSLRSGIGFTFQ